MERSEINSEGGKKSAKYELILTWIFNKYYDGVARKISFTRDDLVTASHELKIPRIKNLGDIPYSFRFRKELPDSIKKKAPSQLEWIILGSGIGKYEFRLASLGRLEPSTNRVRIKIPDATPEIVRHYAPGTDEQALLTRVRYNRLVDIFTGLTCYSIQNHLRTTVKGIGQVEVDEIYVGLNRRGSHFVIPCQAKSKRDRFGLAQVIQDQELCSIRFPYAICKPVAIQFVSSDTVAMLELAVVEEDDVLHLRIVEEKHYDLVPSPEISEEEQLQLMQNEG